MQRRLGYLLNILAVSLLILFYLPSRASAAQVQLAWDQSTDPSIIGYKIYYGTQSGNYQWVVDVGATLSYTLTGLSDSQTYYFAVTAYSSNAESAFSKELVCNFITASTPSNGQITPGGTTALNNGGSQTFSIVPDAGYQISAVYVDGAKVPASSQYTFSNIDTCHTIAASFVPQTTNYSISAASQGGGGSISPSGTVSVPPGTNQTFTISPAANYKISDVQVDGTSKGAVSSYTFSNVAADHTITASFAPLASYTISAFIQGSGSISPAGAVTVRSGASQTFTISPDASCRISRVKVDGRSIGAASSYTFSNVTANHSIEAVFKLNKYSISASSNNGGRISPSGTSAVYSGTDKTYTITPRRHHQLVDVLVDGQSLETGTSMASTGAFVSGTSTGAVTYTFRDVGSNHSIQAVFRRTPPPVVDAGPDQVVKSGSTVTLNGANSTDSASGISSYKWTQTHGPRVTLSNPLEPICTFTAPDTAGGQMLKFKLTVTNNAGITSKAFCFVDVSATGEAPSANAGADQTVYPYTNVTLDGSSSEADGAALSYKWVQIQGTPVEILNARTPDASFVAPNAGPDGVSLVFELRVRDNFKLIARDQCTVNVVNADQPPVADAGPDQTVSQMSSVTLNGSGSNDQVKSADSYRWKQVGGIPVTLSDPTAVNPSFRAPALTGAQGPDLVFMLTVTNVQNQLSDTAKCTVTVKP